jgi:membrane protease YdiL (CAAX protease family)
LSERPRAIGWSLLFLFGGYVLGILLLLLAGKLLPPPEPDSLPEAMIETGALLLGYGALTWLIGAKVLKLRLADLGLRPARRGLKGFRWGALVGVVIATAAMLVAVPLGHAAWRSDGGTVPQWIATVFFTGAIMLPAAFAEELAFRGVPLIALSRGFGRAPAIAVLAVLFGVAHLDNDHVTVLALANIALAGVLLGIAFFTPGGLWTSTGVHLGWNLTLAALAAPVSGTPLPMPWLDYSMGGPRWLTGGAFGPEGGIIASLCILAGVLLAARRRKEVPA